MTSIKIDFSLENKQEKIKLLKLSQFKNLIFFCLFSTLKVYFNTLKDHVM